VAILLSPSLTFSPYYYGLFSIVFSHSYRRLRPILGPLVGGYLGTLGWRWLYWIQLILSGCAWILITFTVPETYAPALLTRRAKKMRKETGDNKYVTEAELDTRPFGQRLRIFLIRPLQLLFLEPIVLFISIYMSVLYGLLYMFFIAYPIGKCH
jgi:MFS family permease